VGLPGQCPVCVRFTSVRQVHAMHLHHGDGRTKPEQADGKKIEASRRFRSRTFAEDMRCFCATTLVTGLGLCHHMISCGESDISRE
jgi:hypothetical protein